MSLHTYDVIQSPWITEKGSKLGPANKYLFRVHPKATKPQIKQAVEEVFNVKVETVNTMNILGKWKRVRMEPGKTSDWKKAVVTLKAGQKIEFV